MTIRYTESGSQEGADYTVYMVQLNRAQRAAQRETKQELQKLEEIVLKDERIHLDRIIKTIDLLIIRTSDIQAIEDLAQQGYAVYRPARMHI